MRSSKHHAINQAACNIANGILKVQQMDINDNVAFSRLNVGKSPGALCAGARIFVFCLLMQVWVARHQGYGDVPVSVA